MRTMKFKIWDQHNKVMTRPAYIHDYMQAESIRIPKGEEKFILQYTENIDRNGTEIYDFDIVRIENKNFQVGYYRGSPTIEYNSNNPHSLLSDFEDVEVIGNWYTNPELLNDQ